MSREFYTQKKLYPTFTSSYLWCYLWFCIQATHHWHCILHVVYIHTCMHVHSLNRVCKCNTATSDQRECGLCLSPLCFKLVGQFCTGLDLWNLKNRVQRNIEVFSGIGNTATTEQRAISCFLWFEYNCGPATVFENLADHF